MPRQPVICKCGSCDSVGYIIEVRLIPATLKILQRAYKCQTVDFQHCFSEKQIITVCSAKPPKNKAIFMWHIINQFLKKQDLEYAN
jgi:hypothetical protein